jgi:hypothetical protein
MPDGKPMIGGEASGGKEGDGNQVNQEQTPVEQGASSSTAAGARSGGIDDLFDQLDLGDEDFEIPRFSFSKRKIDENNFKSPTQHAKQIVKQVKESVASRKVGQDITNVLKSKQVNTHILKFYRV